MKYAIEFFQGGNEKETFIKGYKIVGIDNDMNMTVEGADFSELLKKKGKHCVTVNNLEYWGPFILTHFLKEGYKKDESKIYLTRKKTYNTLISQNEDWYCLRFKHDGTVQFENFRRKIGCRVSEYKRDAKIEGDTCEVIKQAVIMLSKNGNDHLTIGSAALSRWKKMGYTHQAFPKISEDEDSFCRNAYYGGLVGPHVKQEVKERIRVLDCNSLYPFVMCKYDFPVGHGEYYKGKCSDDDMLYIQRLRVTGTLKKGKMPCITVKNKFFEVEDCYFMLDEEMTLTCIDIENMLKNYNIKKIEYIDGYKYRHAGGMFTSYVNYYYMDKVKYKNEDNATMYYLSKIMLNSLSGKFASKRCFVKNEPYIDEELNLKNSFVNTEAEGSYIPAACFITAYGRKELIEASEKIDGKLLCWDTDSLHFTGEIHDIEIHKTKIGAWKVELEADEGVYLGKKMYAEHGPNGWKYTVAGMPDEAKANVNIEDFRNRKLCVEVYNQQRIKGGCIVKKGKFSLR